MEPVAKGVDQRVCTRCGASFHCGINDANGCWCARLPVLPTPAADAVSCLCSRCLRAALKSAVSRR